MKPAMVFARRDLRLDHLQRAALGVFADENCSTMPGLVDAHDVSLVKFEVDDVRWSDICEIPR